jgi:beta-galactosidase
MMVLLMIAAQGHAQSGNAGHVTNLHSLAGTGGLTMAAVEGSLRHSQSLDEGWKFHFGDAAEPSRDFNFSLVSIFAKSGKAAGTAIAPDFSDRDWRTLQLPHDWAVELPFENSSDSDVMAHGYKPVGGLYPRTSIGWYRKHFNLSAADSGRRWVIRFDGVFRDSKVWINGFYLGGNASGYSGFEFDITDYVRFDKENVLAVRVDASQYEGWYYEGAGIYRHVWLDSYEDLHIAQDGVFVHTVVGNESATVTVETTVQNNALSEGEAELTSYVTDRDGRQVGEAVTSSVSVAANGEKTVRQDISVPHPLLWSSESPYLYRAVAVLHLGGRIVDAEKLRIGIRTIRIDSSGLYVNGVYTKIKGVNAHQDHAGVGCAMPDYLYYHRIKLLKEMGANSFRTSHNPPAPELLDACDSLGMLVLDENRLLNSSPEYLDQYRRLIFRDRSRASVFLWSIGNEEGHIQTNPLGRRIAQTLIARQREWDPTRLCTYGADLANEYKGVNEVVPVRGFNYRIFAVDPYHKDHPAQPILGTEMGSTVTTRGIYKKDSIVGYLPDEDLIAPWWANTAEQWWTLAADRSWWMGGFIWTGFDYRGEPTPYQWPNINSHFGVMDMCGFPKNLFYYYQSWWTDKDVLHISPHWNWKGREGKNISVWVNSNADRVTLFLNGRSLGEKVMPRNRHLEWNVAYAPGRLEAVGYRNGRKLTAVVETTGAPCEVVVTPDRTTMLADGKDASVINISVVDKEGREVPDAGDLIHFDIRGTIKIVGVGNGDPSSHEPDKCAERQWQRHLFNGKCQVIVAAGDRPDRVYFEASAPGLRPGSTEIFTVAPQKYVPAPPLPDTTHVRAVGKMMGADISFLPELEDKGIKFTDKGVQKDALLILKEHGFNCIRLRIFNEPARDSGYSPGRGFCDLTHTMQMARRIKTMGMQFLLDFHYSDYWADPGKQYKPEAWKNCDFPSLQDSVYAFTVRVLRALKDQGTPPDMVQVGNEINHGMIWPEGSISRPDSLAALLRAGIRGVRAVDAACPVMLHIALGGQNDESHFFLDNMLRRGVRFDVVGLSYYPKWHGTLTDLSYNVNDLARSYNKDIIIVEYTQLKKEVNQIAFSIPDGHGKGTCIWEPLNTWERIFDEQGRSNELLGIYDELSRRYITGK